MMMNWDFKNARMGESHGFKIKEINRQRSSNCKIKRLDLINTNCPIKYEGKYEAIFGVSARKAINLYGARVVGDFSGLDVLPLLYIESGSMIIHSTLEHSDDSLILPQEATMFDRFVFIERGQICLAFETEEDCKRVKYMEIIVDEDDESDEDD